jgi:hypothetical protein
MGPMRNTLITLLFASLVVAARAEAQQIVVQPGVVGQPVVTQPVVTQPVVVQPAYGQPVAAQPVYAQPGVVDDGRSQGGLDASVALFVTGAILGTLGTGAAWGFLIPVFGCFAEECTVWGSLSATGFIAWGVGIILLITASIVHGVSRGRPRVVRIGEAELNLWTATNDLGTDAGGLQLSF